MKTRNRGFTLPEMMVVVLMVGMIVLMIGAVVSYHEKKKEAAKAPKVERVGNTTLLIFGGGFLSSGPYRHAIMEGVRTWETDNPQLEMVSCQLITEGSPVRYVWIHHRLRASTTNNTVAEVSKPSDFFQ